MSRERSFAVVVLGLFGAAAIACSGGGGGGPHSNEAAGKPSKHGTTNNEDPGTSPEPGDTSMPSSTSPPAPASTDGGADGATPPAGGTQCKAMPTCSSTMALADVPGDANGGETKATGAGSQWYTIRVQKLDFGSTPLSVDVTLTPPQGASYELHVYQSDCTTEIAAPTVNADGSLDVYSSWTGKGENLVIEVRYKSGGCDPSKKWNLDVLGGV